MHILMVLTSHSQLGDTNEKTGFWLEEVVAPYYAFLDAGANITIAALQAGQPPIDPRSTEPENQTEATQRFQTDSEAQATLADPVLLEQVDANNFDALFLPGGHGPMWDLASSDTSARLVESFYAQGKLIGAVCHGPAALVKAKTADGNSILEGRQLTAFTNAEEVAVELDQVVPFSLESRLKELGGEFSQADVFQPHVVTDGNLVTGQNPPASAPTAKAVIEQLSPISA